MAGKHAFTAVAMLLLVMGAQVQASPPLAPRRALPAVAMVAAGGSPTSGGGVKPSTAVVLETKSAVAGDNFNGKDEKFPAVTVAKGAYHLFKYIARHFPTYIAAAGRCMSTIGTHCGWSKVSRHCLQEALHKCSSQGA